MKKFIQIFSLSWSIYVCVYGQGLRVGLSNSILLSSSITASTSAPDGNIYFISSADTFYYLEKFNPQTNTIIWTYNLTDWRKYPHSIQSSNSGIYIVYNSDTTFGIARFSFTGNLLWNKNYASLGTNSSSAIGAADSSNGLILCGAGCVANNTIFHIDSLGNILWQKTYHHVGWWGGSGNSISINSNKNYVVSSGHKMTMVDTTAYLFFMEINPKGDSIIRQTILKPHMQETNVIIPWKTICLQNKDYLLVCDCRDTIVKRSVFYLLDSIGTLKKAYDIHDTDFLVISDVIPINASEILCVGNAQFGSSVSGYATVAKLNLNTGVFSGYKYFLHSSSSWARYIATISKVNSRIFLAGGLLDTGDTLANDFIFKTDSLLSDLCVYDSTYQKIVPQISNSVIIPSFILDTLSFIGYQGDLQPTNQPFYSFPTGCNQNGVFEFDNTSLLVYPNPSSCNQTLHIEFPNIQERIKITFLSSLGENIYSLNAINEREIQICLNQNWKPGIYIVRVEANHNVYHKKIIIKD